MLCEILIQAYKVFFSSFSYSSFSSFLIFSSVACVSFLLNLFRSHGKAWKKFGWKFLFEVVCTNFVNFKNFYKPPPFLSKVIGQSLLKSALFARNQGKINVNWDQKWRIDCCILISSEKSSSHEIEEKESKMDAQLTLHFQEICS